MLGTIPRAVNIRPQLDTRPAVPAVRVPVRYAGREGRTSTTSAGE
jgi:hypothetical protein